MPEPGEKFLCQRAPIKVTFILIGSVPGVKGADTSISKLAFYLYRPAHCYIGLKNAIHNRHLRCATVHFSFIVHSNIFISRSPTGTVP